MFPKPPMRKDAQEALAEGGETGNVEECVGRQVMKLKTIDVEKPTEEIVGRQRKATKKECEEDN